MKRVLIRGWVCELDPTEEQIGSLNEACRTAKSVYNFVRNAWRLDYQAIQNCLMTRRLATWAAGNMNEAVEVKHRRGCACGSGWLQSTDVHMGEMVRLVAAEQHDRNWTLSAQARNAVVTEQFREAVKAFYDPKRDNAYPVRKTRNSRDSFPLGSPNQSFRVARWHVDVAKIGRLKLKRAMRMDRKPREATIFREGSKWFVSVVGRYSATIPDFAPESVLGVNHNVVNHAASSRGGFLERRGERGPVRWVDAEEEARLRRLRRRLSRQERGSHRYEQTKLRIADLEAHIARRRNDAIHVASKGVVRSGADMLVMQNYDVKGMVARKPGLGQRGRDFNALLHDGAMGKFSAQIAYKAEEHPTRVHVYPGHLPSTRRCPACAQDVEPDVGKREVQCVCGHAMNMDTSASFVLRQFGEARLSAERRRTSLVEGGA